jgi:hypothetical protein
LRPAGWVQPIFIRLEAATPGRAARCPICRPKAPWGCLTPSAGSPAISAHTARRFPHHGALGGHSGEQGLQEAQKPWRLCLLVVPLISNNVFSCQVLQAPPRWRDLWLCCWALIYSGVSHQLQEDGVER